MARVIYLRDHPRFRARQQKTAWSCYSEAMKLDEDGDGDGDGAVEAEALYHRALTLDPNFALAMVNLGNLRYKKGFSLEAMALYERAMDLDARLPEARYNLAYILFTDCGQVDIPMSLLRETLAIDPRFADAHFQMGLMYRKKGMAANARRSFTDYIHEAGPNGVFVAEARGYISNLKLAGIASHGAT